jgi:molybdenum cofactor synthesis domain-containing protein
MPIHFGVVTVSDRSSRGERPDTSGPLLVEAILKRNWRVVRTAVVPDDFITLVNLFKEWADSGEMDVLLSTGGTGFGLRDITPEATEAVILRRTPGLVEAMRFESLKITPHAMLSRAAAGIRGSTLIVNLPGSPKAAIENFNVLVNVIPHAVDLLRDAPTAEAGHRSS